MSLIILDSEKHLREGLEMSFGKSWILYKQILKLLLESVSQFMSIFLHRLIHSDLMIQLIMIFKVWERIKI